MDISGSANSHTIGIAGRDKLGDLVDSMLGFKQGETQVERTAIQDLNQANITLKRICETVIDHLGLADSIKVIDPSTTPLQDFKLGDNQIIPEMGEEAWTFLQNWAVKRNVLLSSTPEGNLLFVQPTRAVGATRKVYLRNVEVPKFSRDAQLVAAILATSEVIGDIASGIDVGPEQFNNILSFSSTSDDTQRFHSYTVLSQGNPTTIPDGTASGVIADQSGLTVFDSDVGNVGGPVRPGRHWVASAETSSTAADNTERAKWEANVAQTKGVSYTCTVSGHRNQVGELWAPGDLVQVDDTFVDISSELRLNSVIFSMGPEGSTTELTLLPPNAYTLSLEQPGAMKIGDKYSGTTKEQTQRKALGL
jgi:prophage tail gpP-like protein